MWQIEALNAGDLAKLATVSLKVWLQSGVCGPFETTDPTSPGMPAPSVTLTDENSNFEGKLMCVCPSPARSAVPRGRAGSDCESAAGSTRASSSTRR